jgi:5-methylcytosine-specific restriction endonuclease McrA
MNKKGHIAWNKGLKTGLVPKSAFKKGHKPPKTAFKKGIIPWNKGKKMPEISGKNHPKWKGGYENTLMLRRKRRIMKLGNGGSHTLGEWEILKAQYNCTCPLCKKKEPDIKITEDHIIPLSKGGSDNIENIQPLCVRCNSMKGTKIIDFNI